MSKFEEGMRKFEVKAAEEKAMNQLEEKITSLGVSVDAALAEAAKDRERLEFVMEHAMIQEIDYGTRARRTYLTREAIDQAMVKWKKGKP